MIDNLLVRIHFIIVVIRWTGLAPWDPQYTGTIQTPSPFSGDGVEIHPEEFLGRSSYVGTYDLLGVEYDPLATWELYRPTHSP